MPSPASWRCGKAPPRMVACSYYDRLWHRWEGKPDMRRRDFIASWAPATAVRAGDMGKA
jgi:hypothetical protein